MNISSVYIEIVNICNLDYHSCYNRSGKHHFRRELSLTQIKVISDRLINEFGCTYIALAGGEPTLHSEFHTVLNHLLTYPNIKVGVMTNGTTNEQFLINAYQHIRI